MTKPIEDLKCGNILLCQGESKLSKRIQQTQRIFGASEYEASFTHVAMMYDVRYVMESTTLNQWCGKKGVQVNGYWQWINNYKGHVWLKKLDFVRTQKYYRDNALFWEKYKDEPYENGIAGAWELLWCGLQLSPLVKKILPKWNPKPTDSIHCTELIGSNLEWHKFFADEFYTHQSINRLRPAFWVKDIDPYLNVPVKPLIQLK